MRPPRTIALSPGSSTFKRDADERFGRLRDEAPVFLIPVGFRDRAYMFTRYEDVSGLLADQSLTKDPSRLVEGGRRAPGPQPPRFLLPLTRNMLAMDDPDHARLKTLVQSAFTPRRVEQMEAAATASARALLDRVPARPVFDLVADFALPLPVAVISGLLGIPADDRERFARWSRTLIRIGSAPWAVPLALPDLASFLRYLRHLIAAKRSQPADDLVSALVIASDQEERLNADELLAMVAILLSAGHETTTNFIGNATLALLANPVQLAKARKAGGLSSAAVEELLRFASPVQMTTPRYAPTDVVVGGCRIPCGSAVYGAIASANRDERKFERAGDLDLDRPFNRHLTFGEGGHYCVGAALARMEGRVALNALLERFPSIEVAKPRDTIRWTGNLVLTGPKRLDLKVR